MNRARVAIRRVVTMSVALSLWGTLQVAIPTHVRATTPDPIAVVAKCVDTSYANDPVRVIVVSPGQTVTFSSQLSGPFVCEKTSFASSASTSALFATPPASGTNAFVEGTSITIAADAPNGIYTDQISIWSDTWGGGVKYTFQVSTAAPTFKGTYDCNTGVLFEYNYLTLKAGEIQSVAMANCGWEAAFGGARVGPTLESTGNPTIYYLDGDSGHGPGFVRGYRPGFGYFVGISAPSALTIAASSVSETTATINGKVTENGVGMDSGAPTYSAIGFCLSSTGSVSGGVLDCDLGNPVPVHSRTPAVGGVAAGSVGPWEQTTSASITGLTADTVYSFQVKGTNQAGTTTYGDVLRFRTAKPGGLAPTAATVQAPDGGHVFGQTPTALVPATAKVSGAATTVTFATAPSCDVYATSADSTPMTLNSATAVGEYVVKCPGGVAADGYWLDSYVSGKYTVSKASPSVSYDGATTVATGGSYSAAKLVSPAACSSAATYTLTPSPLSGTGTYTLPNATLTATDWLPGSYAVGVAIASDSNCDAANNSGQTATLTVTQINPTVSYTGDTSVTVGGTLNASASTAQAQCVASPTFTLTPSPVTGSGSLTLASASVAATNWRPGTYSISADYPGDVPCAQNSGSASLSVRAQAPGAPIVSGGDSTATFSWPAVPSATSYKILGGEFSCTPSAAATTCTVTGLTNGTTYTFTLVAVIGGVDSAPSAPARVRPLALSTLTTGAAQEDGLPVGTTVGPNATGKGLAIVGSSWSMDLGGLDAAGDPLPLASGTLVLEQTRQAAVSGTGFEPNSQVQLYMYSAPRYIGTFTTDSSGSFAGTANVPGDVPEGRHTLQATGFAPGGVTRSLSLPVVLNKPASSSGQENPGSVPGEQPTSGLTSVKVLPNTGAEPRRILLALAVTTMLIGLGLTGAGLLGRR